MNNQVQKAKRLSYMLRHSTEPLYIELNGGWASVGSILAKLEISRALDQRS